MSATATALLAGTVVGLGLFLLVLGVYPQRPSLAATVTALRYVPAARPILDASPTDRSQWAARLGRRFVGLLGKAVLPSVPSDLRLLDRSMERHIGEKVGFAVGGFLLPSATTAIMLLGGITVAFELPLGASAILALGGFLFPDVGIHRDAAARRHDFRYALGSFLDLVTIALSAGSGVEGALWEAATAGRTWPFAYLRRALDTARLTREQPWDALSRLGEEIGVAELCELSASVRLAGTEGARVRQSLMAKATTLRTRQLAEAEAEARSATERMVIPGAFLIVGFLILMVYPQLAQIMSSLKGGR